MVENKISLLDIYYDADNLALYQYYFQAFQTLNFNKCRRCIFLNNFEFRRTTSATKRALSIIWDRFSPLLWMSV